MFISRLLAISLLSSACAAQVAVQSPQDKGLTTNPPETKSPYPAPEFNLQNPGPTAKTGTNWRVLQFQPPVHQPGPTVAQSNTCYFIQTYRFTRDNPQSDAVRFTGQSTCAPAAQFQLKEADGQLDIAPH